jgi:hypothetical protein
LHAVVSTTGAGRCTPPRRFIQTLTLDWRRIYPLLVDTLSLTVAVMLIIGTATAMALVPGGSGGFLRSPRSRS